MILANDHAALGVLDLDVLSRAAHPQALVYDLCGQTLRRVARPGAGQELRVLGGARHVGVAEG